MTERLANESNDWVEADRLTVSPDEPWRCGDWSPQEVDPAHCRRDPGDDGCGELATHHCDLYGRFWCAAHASGCCDTLSETARLLMRDR